MFQLARLDTDGKLPVELLREIFLYSQEEKTRWVLCAVCRKWRAIAISTPLLWSRISLIPDHYIEAIDLIPRLELLGAQSGQSPLHIKWNLIESRYHTELYQQLLLCMVQVIPMSRWKSLEISDHSYVPPLPPEIFSTTAQCHDLEEIHNFAPGTSVGELLKLLDRMNASPRLFRSRYVPFGWCPLPKMQSSVTKLDLRFISGGVMRCISSLETLTVLHLSITEPIETTLRYLYVHNLKLKALHYLQDSVLEVIEADRFEMTIPLSAELRLLRRLQVKTPDCLPLPYLHLPQLEILQITAPEYQYEGADLHFKSMLEIPSYSLNPTTLHLDIRISISTILLALRHSLLVQHLRLIIYERAGDIDELLTALVHTTDSAPMRESSPSRFLCPNLRTLHMRLSSDGDSSITTFMNYPRASWTEKAKRLLEARSSTNLEEIRIQWQNEDTIFISLCS
jgi:hypothetical protein